MIHHAQEKIWLVTNVSSETAVKCLFHCAEINETKSLSTQKVCLIKVPRWREIKIFRDIGRYIDSVHTLKYIKGNLPWLKDKQTKQ